MKILNGYCGIGGNRKLWGDEHKITAVEINSEIANIYKDFFPNDEVIVTDAHQYLLEYYKEYDFIWLSPPCPSHSDIRRCGVHKGQYEAIYPDMTLYQEIILLRNFFKGKYCVENVKPYYKPLIEGQEVNRHLFWTNFFIYKLKIKTTIPIQNIINTSIVYNTDLSKYDIKDKRKLLRNMVNPKIGKHIFDCCYNNKRTNVMDLF